MADVQTTITFKAIMHRLDVTLYGGNVNKKEKMTVGLMSALQMKGPIGRCIYR